MKRITLFLIIGLSLQFALPAQQRTHMPYSLYGLGDLVPKGFSRNMAMGRTGIAMSSPRYMNNLNPASYHTIDSISFFFDLGLTGNFVKYRTNRNPAQYGNDVNIANMAIGFGITRNWKTSVGVAPFSQVGYRIQTSETVTGSPAEIFNVEINGNGGLNHFYWNNSYELFNHLALGVNFTYLFGTIQSTETSTAPFISGEFILNESSYYRQIFADFGFQSWFTLAKNWNITLGGVFGQNHRINITNRFSASGGTSDADEEITDESSFTLPLYIGGGISAEFKNRLTITADYIYRDWASAGSGDNNYKYRSNNVFRLGAELIPGRYSQLGYFGGIAYRAGIFYEESYLEISNTLIPEYGITAGLGFPFLQNRTTLNIAYNYGIKGTLEKNLVRENSHSFMFSLTMHDWWFLKRRID